MCERQKWTVEVRNTIIPGRRTTPTPHRDFRPQKLDPRVQKVQRKVPQPPTEQQTMPRPLCELSPKQNLKFGVMEQ